MTLSRRVKRMREESIQQGTTEGQRSKAKHDSRHTQYILMLIIIIFMFYYIAYVNE